MKLNVENLVAEMCKAASGVLKSRWPKAKDYAQSEFTKLVQEAIHIAELRTQGKISEMDAQFLMELQRNAARVVLLTIQGLGIIAVQNAINAALAVVRDTINSAVGVTLL